MSTNPIDKFKIVFNLKQHTPIIHFQSDQKGATLRATELKPKFDKFLLDQVKGIPFIKNANGSKSLDYKVTIEQNISKREEINDKHPLYFGNMKPKEKTDIEWDKLKKRFKYSDKVFKITFFSYNEVITRSIKDFFEAFLANTNFGTRQSKGFGGFYLDKSFNEELITHKLYSFSSTARDWEKDIKLFYSFLRQGVNLPDRNSTRFYSKPAIFLYMKSKNITWDKKAIKEKYFNSDLLDQQQDHPEEDNCVNYDSNTKYLVRDLFGLSVSQEWKKPYYKTIKKEDVKKDKNNKPLIQRFKSPITFKVIQIGNKVNIYFWADNSVENLLNQKFIIKTVNRGRVEQSDLVLSTPDKFSFADFFDFTFNLNLEKIINEKYKSQNEYKKLVRIFNEIKESK